MVGILFIYMYLQQHTKEKSAAGLFNGAKMWGLLLMIELPCFSNGRGSNLYFI